MRVELVARDENEERVEVAGGDESVDQRGKRGARVLPARVQQAGEQAERCEQHSVTPCALHVRRSGFSWRCSASSRKRGSGCGKCVRLCL